MTPGEVIEAVYPFVRSTYEAMDSDSEGVTFSTQQTWKPGTRNEPDGDDGCECVADALGKVVLTVASVHKPGPFPTRVFFVRTWVDPDGKAFGKRKCRVTTAHTFRVLASGYRHPFILLGCDCDGCDWPTSDHRRTS